MKNLFLRLIRFYQRRISPNTPPRCRYYPTCSAYTYTAIERYGAFRGFFMGLWRILRCNPFSAGGWDPVPEIKIKEKKNEKREAQLAKRGMPKGRVPLAGQGQRPCGEPGAAPPAALL